VNQPSRVHAWLSVLIATAVFCILIAAAGRHFQSAIDENARGSMSPDAAATYLLSSVVVGLGATLFMDLWVLLLQRAFGTPSANYCLVGRWLRHMPEGTFVHASIANSSQKRFECAVGWIAHYIIGVAYALLLVALVSGDWLARPTLLPPLLFGVGTVLVPFLVMQPSFGLGVAASRAPSPTQARLRSLMAHIAFGIGLYVCAVGVTYVGPVHA
jgi:hypothetical protein